MFIEVHGLPSSSAKSEMPRISLFAKMVKESQSRSYKHLAALRREINSHPSEK